MLCRSRTDVSPDPCLQNLEAAEGAGLTTHAGAAISRNTAQRVAVTSEAISRAGLDALHLLRSAATAGAPLPDDHAAAVLRLENIPTSVIAEIAVHLSSKETIMAQEVPAIHVGSDTRAKSQAEAMRDAEFAIRETGLQGKLYIRSPHCRCRYAQ